MRLAVSLLFLSVIQFSTYAQSNEVASSEAKDDSWVTYHEDGKTPRIKGEPEGRFFKYYADGAIKEKGTMVKYKYVDVLERYYQNGALKELHRFDEAGQTLETTYYNEDGCPTLFISFDKQTGKTDRIKYDEADCKK